MIRQIICACFISSFMTAGIMSIITCYYLQTALHAEREVRIQNTGEMLADITESFPAFNLPKEKGVKNAKEKTKDISKIVRSP